MAVPRSDRCCASTRQRSHARAGHATTRSLAVVATGERVFRDEVLPGAILTRVAASHVRVGSFQYFAAREDAEGAGN